MIRAKIKQRISSILDENPHFNYNDFQIDINKERNNVTPIRIVYEYDNQYFIEFGIPIEKSTFSKQESVTNIMGTSTMKNIEYQEYKIEGRMCPGQMAYKESFKYEGINGITNALKSWLNNLWEDITITPENRIFNAQKEEIEKIKAKVKGLPDEYFTVDEGNELKERLQKIESQLSEKLANETPDKEEAQKQIEKLHEEIEVLKQTIYSLKKTGWFKSFITKTMTWLSDPTNQKLLKAGKDLVTNMLPENTP